MWPLTRLAHSLNDCLDDRAQVHHDIFAAAKIEISKVFFFCNQLHTLNHVVVVDSEISNIFDIVFPCRGFVAIIKNPIPIVLFFKKNSICVIAQWKTDAKRILCVFV